MPRDRTTARGLVVYGLNAVRALLAHDTPVERLVVAGERRHTDLVASARRRGVPCETADRGTLDRLAGSPHHQDVVAVAAPYRYAELADLARDAPSALVLDSIQDPRNLGAILRTARAAGVGAVVVPQDRSVGITPAVVHASAGCLFGLRVARVTNLVRAMEAMKAANFWLVGLVAGAAQSCFELPPIERPAVVVGGEGEGLRPLVRRTCDFEASLPMASGVESLNVSVATGIALYELCVRRRTAR